MTGLIARLRDRKFVQWALAYVAAAFALIQVLDIVAQRFGWPEAAIRFVIVAMAIGFFVTLVLAWYHGERGAQRVSGTELLILAVLLGIGGGALWRAAPTVIAAKSEAEPGVSNDTHSVAVLPFVNMSDDKNNAYFSDGISEEILNVLARIPDLHVAARTSSFSFRNKEKEIPTIAQELKVRMVLEGSVRKQGERVRVTAQLIDAGNGYHVWSQTYDRDLKDIFAIQDEIANAIANELQLKLDTPHPSGAAVADTADMAAYDSYLRGMALWQARGGRNLHDAIDLFRAALARDPGYAKAWAGLALTYAILPEWSGSDPLAQTSPLARDAAEHALALDSAAPEPYAVLGYMAATEFRFGTARAMFKRALTLAPSYATGYQWSGETLLDEGDLDAALAMSRKAAALDPKSGIVNSVLTNILVTVGRDDEAVALCDTIVAVESEWCPLVRFEVAMARRDYTGARAAVEAAAKARGPQALSFFNAQMDALDGKGDVQGIAQKLLDMPDGQSNPDSLTPLAAYDAMFWFMAIGRNDLAIERFAHFARLQPYVARQLAFDHHLDALHCEAKFLDLLRSIHVEEPHLATQCKKAAT